MYNEQIVSLFDSVHSELKMIVEDEIFERLSAALPTIGQLINLVAKIDVTLSFVQFLRSMPNGVEICRPKILDGIDHEEERGINKLLCPSVVMKSARNPLLISAKCTQIAQAKALSSIANDIKANNVLINNIQSKV